jgi:hypothetical protein
MEEVYNAYAMIEEGLVKGIFLINRDWLTLFLVLLFYDLSGKVFRPVSFGVPPAYQAK